VVGLGYNILDRGATIPLDMEGLAYGVGVADRKPTTCYRLFYSDTDLVYMPKLDTSSAIRFTNFCAGAENLVCTQEEFDTSGATNYDFSYMFQTCRNLKRAPKMDLSMATNVIYAFTNCSAMSGSCDYDLSSCGYVTNMFYGCASIVSVTLRNTGNCQSFRSVFSNCANLESVGEIDASSATNLQQMFYGCIKIDNIRITGISGSVGYIDSMFTNCNNLKNLDADFSDISGAASCYSMFGGCTSLKRIGNIGSSGATDIQGMFRSCTSLERIESLDMSSVTNVTSTFNSLTALRFMKLVNLGKSSLTSYVFNAGTCQLWGDNSTDVPDALDSLVWTFKNLYDRTGNGMSGCTISLWRTIYDRLMAELTDAEKATYFTNKGYTITRL
jgi:hypothetical protein